MRLTRFYHSLRFKIIACLVAIVAISMGGFFYIETILHRRHLIQSLDESSSRYISNIIKRSLRDAMMTRDFDEMRNIMSTVHEQEDVLDILLINKRGEVVVAPNGDAVGRVYERSDPACKVCHGSESNDRPKTVLSTNNKGQEIIRNVSPVLNEPQCHQCHDPDKKVIGVLVTDFSLSGIDVWLGSEFRQNMMALTFFLMVIIGVLSFSVDRFVLRRLERFATVTKLFGRGDFSQDLPEKSQDEIGRLSEVFNQMAADLREYIAESKRAEEEVKRARDYLNTTANSINDGLIVIEKDYTISFANEAYAKQAGMEVGDIIGRPCYSVSHSRDDKCRPPEHECPLDTVFETRQPKVVFHQHVDKEGKEIWAEINASPMFDEFGNVVRAVEIVRDITDRKKTELELHRAHDELKESNLRLMQALKDLQEAQNHMIQSEKLASLGVMAGGIAHEIRNPLATISSCSQLLLNNRDNPEFIAACAGRIHTNTNRASLIIENLLKFARPPERDVEDVHINAALQESLVLMQSQFTSKGIRVEQYFDPSAPSVKGNKSLLQHVFLNLTLNACNAMTKADTLTVSTTTDDKGRVGIIFRDTGCGIQEDNLSKIFDPFFTTMTGGKGTGLGLSISYSIVKQHNGMIEVKSTEGEGTTFTVWLPPEGIESGQTSSSELI